MNGGFAPRSFPVCGQTTVDGHQDVSWAVAGDDMTADAGDVGQSRLARTGWPFDPSHDVVAVAGKLLD